jgi:hypothetical protein
MGGNENCTDAQISFTNGCTDAYTAVQSLVVLNG